MYRIIQLALLGLLFLTAVSEPLAAQAPLRWSIARRIPGYADDASPPILVADENRTVHAFSSQLSGANLAIYYNRWTPESGWTRPNDILLSPVPGGAEIMDAFLDARGILHVVFFAGNNISGQLYYSRAPAASADKAPEWSTPVLLDANASNPSSGSLTGDASGNLYVVYSGNGEGNGTYIVSSNDGGVTWSQPKNGFLTNSGSLWVFAIQTALDERGQVQAVWTVVNKGGNGEAVYYARFEPDRNEWSLPITLQDVKGNDYEADWATILPFNNELFVIYNYGFPPFRWMRRSTDGGDSWSAPVKAISSLKGENGHPVLMIDSNQVMHMIFANRTLDDVTHGLWHSEWLGDQWSEPQAIIAGPGSARFSPDNPQATIVQGNNLLVTWRQDPGLTGNGVWFSNAILDSPEYAVKALPTPKVTLTAVAQTPSVPSPTPRPSPTPQGSVVVASNGGTPSALPSISPTMTLAVTVASVLAFLSVILIARKLHSLVTR